MRKIILIASLLTVAIGVGFASVRLRTPQLLFKPHTITYRLTFYDEAGNVTGTNVVVRRVLSDGTWKHTQIKMDGSVVFTHGQLKRLLTSRTADASLPEHLQFKYFASKNSDAESWTSPELQDYLMFTSLRTDGSKLSSLEAVDISTP